MFGGKLFPSPCTCRMRQERGRSARPSHTAASSRCAGCCSAASLRVRTQIALLAGSHEGQPSACSRLQRAARPQKRWQAAASAGRARRTSSALCSSERFRPTRDCLQVAGAAAAGDQPRLCRREPGAGPSPPRWSAHTPSFVSRSQTRGTFGPCHPHLAGSLLCPLIRLRKLHRYRLRRHRARATPPIQRRSGALARTPLGLLAPEAQLSLLSWRVVAAVACAPEPTLPS
jgi:hypothetical protein